MALVLVFGKEGRGWEERAGERGDKGGGLKYLSVTQWVVIGIGIGNRRDGGGYEREARDEYEHRRE